MITMENIKTGEIVTFTADQDASARQAQMAAYLNSSNLSPNALKGQDFGWRLAPEIVAKMDAFRANLEKMDSLARRIGVGIDDIRDFHILNYLAEQEFAAEAMRNRKATETSIHEQRYNERLNSLRQNGGISDSKPETTSAKIEAPVNNKKEK